MSDSNIDTDFWYKENGIPIVPQEDWLDPNDERYTAPFTGNRRFNVEKFTEAYKAFKEKEKRKHRGRLPKDLKVRTYPIRRALKTIDKPFVKLPNRTVQQDHPKHNTGMFKQTVKHPGILNFLNLPSYAKNFLKENLGRTTEAKRWKNKKIGEINKDKIPLVLEGWLFAFNSYRPSSQLEGWNYEWFDYANENSGFIAYTTNKFGDLDLVFSFRGTQSDLDVLEDAASGVPGETFYYYCNRSLFVPITPSYAPAKRVKNVEGKVETIFFNNLIKMIGPTTNILIVGHSLGGGVAEAFAAVFAQLLPESLVYRTTLITYEGMRGLTTESVDGLLKTNSGRVLDENAIRVYNDKDWVPNMPPSYLGFKHLGKAWYLSKKLTEGFDGSEFDVNTGPHSMVPTSTILQRLMDYAEDPDFDDYVYVTDGRGKIN